MRVSREAFADTRHPSRRNHEGQSQVFNFADAGKHTFLHQRHACRINVVATLAKGRLGDAILEQYHRSSAVDDDRASAAKVVQRMDVEDVELGRGRPAIEFRRQGLGLGQITSADQDFPIAGPPEFGRNNSPGCAVAAHNAESDRSTHCLSLLIAQRSATSLLILRLVTHDSLPRA